MVPAVTCRPPWIPTVSTELFGQSQSREGDTKVGKGGVCVGEWGVEGRHNKKNKVRTGGNLWREQGGSRWLVGLCDGG